MSTQDTKYEGTLLPFTFAVPLPTEAVLSPGCGLLRLPTCLEGVPSEERKCLVKFSCSLHYCGIHRFPLHLLGISGARAFFQARQCRDYGEEGRGRALLNASSSPQSPTVALSQLGTLSSRRRVLTST